MTILFSLATLCALFGLSVCTAIARQKRVPNAPMVCAPGYDCSGVVTSQYSNFWGIPLESIGTVFYTVMTVFSLFLALFHASLPSFALACITFLLTVITGAAVCVSIYLMLVQAYALRKWCVWCTESAFTTVVLFGLYFMMPVLGKVDIMPVVLQFALASKLVYLFGFAIGLGAATVSDVLLLRLVRNFTLTEETERLMRYTIQGVWVGLLFILIGGACFYTISAPLFVMHPAFLMPVIVVLVMLIHGTFLHLVVSPRLVEMSKGKVLSVTRAARLRRLAFAFVGMSFVSWYGAFALSLLPPIQIPLLTLIGWYIGALIVVVVASQILERLFAMHKND